MIAHSAAPTARSVLVRIAATIGATLLLLLLVLAIVRPEMMSDLMHMAHRMIPLWCPC